MTTISHAAVALIRAGNIGFRTGFSQRDMRDNLAAPLVFAEQTFQQFGRASFRRGKQASQRQPSRRARYHLSWQRQLGPGRAVPPSISRQALACGILKPCGLWRRFQPEIGFYVHIKLIKKLPTAAQAGLPRFSPALAQLLISQFAVRRRRMAAYPLPGQCSR